MDRREGKRRKAEENSLKVFLGSGGERNRERGGIISFSEGQWRPGLGDEVD
jgi:hypothetical protein